MKKLYINILLFTIGALLCSSCLKTHNPESYANKEDIFTSEAGLESYTNSFYLALPNLKTIPICEASKADYAVCRGFDNFYLDNAFNAETSTSWSWSDLRNINYFLDGLEEYSSRLPEGVKNHYEGIARWFRAYFYYNKLTKYGAVPWFEHCLSNSQVSLMYKNRDSRDVIIGHIIDDLDFAWENISTEESVGNTLISRYAALALKSRACLFEATWRKYHNEEGTEFTTAQLFEECIDACRKLIDTQKFKLNTTVAEHEYISTKGAYRSLFYSRDIMTDEVILGVLASKDDNVMGDANYRFNSATYGDGYCLSRAFIFTYLKTDGSRFTDQADYSAISFVDEFSNRDKRLEQTVKSPSYKMFGNGTLGLRAASIASGIAPTGYQPIKFVEDAVGRNNSAKNENSLPIIRYGEVLLNYAEALAETGKLTNALWKSTIGALRTRAGFSSSSAAVTSLPTSVDPYLQKTFYPDITNPVILEIRRERAIELVYEGFRVNDLNRWKEGHCLADLPWTGIHFTALDTPININNDTDWGAIVYDYYFTEKEITEIPGKYKALYVKVLPADTPGQGLKYKANPAGGYDLYYDLAISRKWYDDDRLYLYPIPAQIVRDYKNRGYVIDQNPNW